ncbi:MAG TPA: response regulator transcription factor [Aeromicrobium sp.]|nr:response regulator transcription factor [Aeromicrobium sp.]
MIRVVVVDDHRMFRDGVRSALSLADDIEIAGEAADAASAMAVIETELVDVVLMDVGLPDRSGVDVTRDLMASRPDVAVLVLSMHEDQETVFAAMRAGARGYLAKGADQGELTHAVRAVADGAALFGPGIADRLLGFFAATKKNQLSPFPELSEREREVLELIASGTGNELIAERLGLSVKTVRNHVSNILNKLQVLDRTAAAVRARDAGLGRSRRES